MVIVLNGNTDRDGDSSHSGRNYWDRHGGLRLGLSGTADNCKNLTRAGLTALPAFVAGHPCALANSPKASLAALA